MSYKKIIGVAMAALLSGLVSVACPPTPTTAKVTSQPLPSLFSNWAVFSTFIPRSQKFKIVVLTFVDQTGRASIVVDPVADMLTAELNKVGRFELFDRRDLGKNHVTTVVKPGGGAAITGGKTKVFKTERRDKTSTQYK